MKKTLLFAIVCSISSFAFADVLTCNITEKLSDTLNQQQTVVIKMIDANNGDLNLIGRGFTKDHAEKITAYTRYETYDSLDQGQPVQRQTEILGIKIESVQGNPGDVNLKASAFAERPVAEAKVQLQLSENYSVECSLSADK